MASSFQTLTKIKRPFADTGQRNNIPDSVASTSNLASMQAGWNSTTSTPIDEGGIPPNRLDFNGLGYLATQVLLFLQQGGFMTYDATVSSNIGGYPKGAILWVLNSNGLPAYAVRSQVNNNTNNPATNMSGWEKCTIDPKGGQMTGYYTDVTAEQLRNIKIVTTEPTTGTNGTIYAIIES